MSAKRKKESTMPTIKELLERIVEYNNLPKFQVERALSPIISFYIANMISKIKNGDEIKLITPEFPLKKENNQSKNIDYLLVNQSKKKLILVELKTDFRACKKDVLEHQSNYENVIHKLKENKAIYLVNDINDIYEKSKQKDKYEYLKDRANNIDREICSGEILYIVPKEIKAKIMNTILEDTSIVSFDELPSDLNGADENYKLLFEALQKLNSKKPKQKRK